MRSPHHRLLFGLVCSMAVLGLVARPASAASQDSPPRVVVRDSIGRPVPYASIQASGSTPRTASDSGIALLRVPRADSLKLLARRVGFAPFEGWVKPDADGSYVVQLNPLAQNLNRVTIYDRDTPLARTGFYDRMERVERGAVVARFWTPEAIELRNPGRVSDLLTGENLVRVRRVAGGRTMVVGRNAQCPVGLIVDGQRMLGTVEELATREGEDDVRELMRKYASRPEARDLAEREYLQSRMSIDEIVTSLSIVAVEIYGSLASAPAELQRNAPSYACSLVVVWTGRRG